MALSTEGVKFSDFVNGLSSLTEEEKNAAKVPALNGSGTPKSESLGNYAGARKLSVVSNPEYAYAIVDAEGKFLFGIKSDGSVEWAVGIPEPVKEQLNEVITSVAAKVDKEDGKSLINENLANAIENFTSNDYSTIIENSAGQPLEAIRKSDGARICFNKLGVFGGIELNEESAEKISAEMRKFGIGNQSDFSDEARINIPKPKFAVIKITDALDIPTTKTNDYSCYFEFNDMNGNYFKKKAVINAQGNSSLSMPKKNIAVDLLNDDGEAFSLKIGDWVAQDSFHLKAYYTDFFRGVGSVGYDIYEDILNTRSFDKNRTWKQALVNIDKQHAYAVGVGQNSAIKLRIDNGARCFPAGFPCVVYFNGEFYGLFAFQLKKHRDNYVMDKSEKLNIHLDGMLNAATFFNGTVDWTQFEVRNPKIKKDKDGNTYDGDNPTEIPDGATHDAITNFSSRMTQVNAATTTEEKKVLFETYFDVDNLIDYLIFGDVTNNYDGFAKNWQWTTWDGVKWFVNAYDLDMLFGNAANGKFIRKPLSSHLGQTGSNWPTKFLVDNYAAEIKSRYKELRSAGVISTKAFVSKLACYTKNVGDEAYKMEYEKWSDCPCNKQISIKTDNWELVTDDDGNPSIVNGSSNYNASTEYAVGDIVMDNDNSQAGWCYQFKCIAGCAGVRPAYYNIVDSIFRVQKWIEENFVNMDKLYNYTEE